MTVIEDAQGRPQFITPGETDGMSWHHRKEVIATRIHTPWRQLGYRPPVLSPAPGITWDRDRWRVFVGGGKTKRHHLGRFDTVEQAVEARNHFLASAGTSHPGSVGLKKIISGLELKPARANKTSAPRTRGKQ